MTCHPGPAGQRLTGPRHDANHHDCQPCPEPHCVVCGTTHLTTHPQTCPGCITAARTNLAQIVQLTIGLADHAHHGGHDGHLEAARDLPGGEATALRGPGAMTTTSSPDESPADQPPPLLLLATWVEDWAHTLGHPTPQWLATLGTEARWLARQLHVAAQQHPAFDEFTTDLARCRAHLEAVLHAGDRPELTKTPCTKCGVRLTAEYGKTAADDRWACPACHRRYSAEEFILAQHHHLASEDANRWVTLTSAAHAARQSTRTVRTWVNRLQVGAYCERVSHRVMVWWPDVRDRSRESQRRQVLSAARRGRLSA